MIFAFVFQLRRLSAKIVDKYANEKGHDEVFLYVDGNLPVDVVCFYEVVGAGDFILW